MGGKMFRQTNCITKEHASMLKMVFLDTVQRQNFWEEWRAVAESDKMDMDMYGALPLVYDALSSIGIEHGMMDKFKGARRRAWCKNQRVIHQMKPILDYFKLAGIDAIFPKDIAIMSRYYNNAFRPIYDIDILVRKSDMLKAVSAIESADWSVKQNSDPSAFGAQIEFTDEIGQSIFLRYQLAQRYFNKNFEKDIWESKIPIKIGEAEAFALCDPDQLFYLCAYGLEDAKRPSLISLGDAARIINSAGHGMDWDRVTRNAKRALCMRPLKNSLCLLNDDLSADIPDAVIEKTINTSALFETIEAGIANRRVPLLRNLVLTYAYYLRSANVGSFKFKPMAYLEYLREIFGLKSVWQLPRHILLTGMKNVWQYDIVPLLEAPGKRRSQITAGLKRQN